jgi:hypothetical protein
MTNHQPSPAEILAAVERAATATTSSVDRLRAAVVNDTLTTETVVLPASGVVERTYQGGYGSVTVANPGAGAVTASSSSGGDPAKPPASGVGVFAVPAGRFATLPMRGHSLTLYGAAGAVLVLSVSAKPLPPAFGVCS